MKEDTVIIILGPTAVGKTAAAIRLAQLLHTEIISADSRQCFREMNIGVAKPSLEELQAVHHYFINSHSIDEEVTAATFEALALGWASSASVMVGGTGLYIKAFTDGLDAIPPVDPAIRRQVQEQYAQEGLFWLQSAIREEDPGFYTGGEIQNPQRMMRALEVKRSTGLPIFSFRNPAKKQRPFLVEKIGLQLPKEELHSRIHLRVDHMMQEGLLEEVRRLIPHRDRNALQTVGYSELFAYFDGKTSLDAAVDEIKKNTRRYARRQLTWFRKDPAVRWVDAHAFLADPLQYVSGVHGKR